MKSRVDTLIGALTAAVLLGLALWFRPAAPSPAIHLALGPQLEADFLGTGTDNRAACKAALASDLAHLSALCPDCKVQSANCQQRLDGVQGEWLSVGALATPSARLLNGVIVYQGPEVQALMACTSLESGALPIDSGAQCWPARMQRPRPAANLPDAQQWQPVLLAGTLAFLVSLLTSWALVRFKSLHAHLSMDAVDGGPQKFHTVPTPRIGGIAVMAGLLVAAGLFVWISPHGQRGLLARLLLASAPAFLGGLVEDLTHRVGVTSRLLLTMAAGASAAWIAGAVLARLAIPGVDPLLTFYPIALIVTMVAVGGLANALNIIDGYNGLCAGTAAIALLGLAGLALKVGDILMLKVIIATFGACVGFLLWNWPGGRIFLGDGGAYLIGFLLAEFSVLLVVRNPSVSPWCGVALLAHPVVETLFSIYRRKMHRNQNPGAPDRLHLHQLIYSRVVRYHVGSKATQHRLARNSLVAPVLWIPALVTMLIVQIAWNSSRYPVALTVLYATAYIYSYKRIVDRKVPRWLVSMHSTKFAASTHRAYETS